MIKLSKIRIHILVTILLVGLTSVAEQNSNTNTPPEKPSLGDLLIDPEDGMLDASEFLGTAKGFLPTGSIITEPAVGYGGALALLFFHDSIANRAEEAKKRNPDGTLKRLPPPSITGVGGVLTENGTWGSGLFHMGIWKEDRIRYLGGLGYVSANLDYYLPGNRPLLPDSVSYNLDGGFLLQQMMMRVGESDFFLGANYQYSSFEAEMDIKGFTPPSWFPPLSQTFEAGGVGLVAQYDNRNTIFTPDSGMDAKLESIFYNEAVGSERDFTRINSYCHYWIPVTSSWVLGLRYDGKFSGEDTPFYMLPFIDLRGIPAVRYQGQYVLTGEAELRWDITPRWSAVGFFGGGRVADDELSDFSDADTHMAGGFGWRYLISRVFGVRTGMDFAWSEEDFAFYFTTGTAW